MCAIVQMLGIHLADSKELSHEDMESNPLMICCLQFWTALFWVTTVDLLVRHFGMVVKVCL